METKTCKTCGCTKSLNEFPLCNYGKYYEGTCKQCTKEYKRKWRAENLEQFRECKHKWNAEHPEKCKKYRRKWYIEHIEQSLGSCRKWRKEHPEYKYNYDQTPQGKLSRKNVNHNRRARTKGQKITLDEWTAIKQHQHFRCYWCKRKFKDEELQMDHVIPLKRGGLHEASNIVAACQHCNSKKHTSIWSLV